MLSVQIGVRFSWIESVVLHGLTELVFPSLIVYEEVVTSTGRLDHLRGDV